MLSPLQPISVCLQGPPISSSTRYLDAVTAQPKPQSKLGNSQLLDAIRIALRGSGTDEVTRVHTEYKSGLELTWNASNVILSSGGVLYKRWTFHEEGQTIQWACMGLLQQSTLTSAASASSSAARYTSGTRAPALNLDTQQPSRPTFGPFAQEKQDNEQSPDDEYELIPATFIFLRSIGKIMLETGANYTFSLPFIVRKAWPLSPHGVMMQRVLEPGEISEAEAADEALLPTVFSMTSPLEEACAVGWTSGIQQHSDGIRLQNAEEHANSPLKSIPPEHVVLWTSNSGGGESLCITMDASKQKIFLWRYVYIKPRDIPLPPPPAFIPTEPTLPTPVDTSTPILNADGFPEFNIPAPVPPLSALPGMPPSLSLSMPASLSLPPAPIKESQSLPQASAASHWFASSSEAAPTIPASKSNPIHKQRRNSLTRRASPSRDPSTIVTMDMDRMALDVDNYDIPPIDHGRMQAAYWMELLWEDSIDLRDTTAWRKFSAALFDNRWDGTRERTFLAVCLPATLKVTLLCLAHEPIEGGEATQLKATPVALPIPISAIAVVPIRSTRSGIDDLLMLSAESSLSIFTHGLHEIPLSLNTEYAFFSVPLVAFENPVGSSVTLVSSNGTKSRLAIDFIPHDRLTFQVMQVLSCMLPEEEAFMLYRAFLHDMQINRGQSEWTGFTAAMQNTFLIGGRRPEVQTQGSAWNRLGHSVSHHLLGQDFRLNGLKKPPNAVKTPRPYSATSTSNEHKWIGPILYALHIFAEDLRLNVHRYEDLMRLVPLICNAARLVRPEWVDYWARLCPDAADVTMNLDIQNSNPAYLDDRISVWPPDLSAILYGRISNPEWRPPTQELSAVARRMGFSPSFQYGRILHDHPLQMFETLTNIYIALADNTTKDTQRRAENAVLRLVESQSGSGVVKFVDRLPLGIAAPLREAMRTCQLAPPGDWPLDAYRAIGRDDLAASAEQGSDMNGAGNGYPYGYRPSKVFINNLQPKKTIMQLCTSAHRAANGEPNAVTGVEVGLAEFTSIRFGQDRRLDEVARMLCSSSVPSVKIVDRPELSETDQTKEQQHQVVRIAERTLALPYGRAMYTFGTVLTVTREAYAIPKMEFAVRIQPLNLVQGPEPGKIPAECLHWGEFHNGVAAGLRIAPGSKEIESSWIAFNKPAELTPEHAGFLFALGLTGHLKEMLTWHTFGYLTPKHDLTSIGVLLGLAAANVGSGNRHVTKLLAVHTPALLPTPTVDLNVSLMTQAAGLAGVGLLYMGTKTRRMAEVCINQISRKDLVQPDITNEHREAYTYSAALAFGMIMLAKGSSVPADMVLVARLQDLIHGDPNSVVGPNGSKTRSNVPLFDINLTSPAATIALGLMYLRTERRDIAGILRIPDTVLALNRVQPSFLLMRTVARSLIMWKNIMPTNDWINSQIPLSILQAMDARFKHNRPVDDAFELAYYNLLAGACFVIGLKYAGTARQEAYLTIIGYFDMFSRLVYSSVPAFDHKIKRAAVRDGLNLISVSLSMVMAGTGEITCFRRLRYAYGMYQQASRYGIHLSTHTSIGLLFLGVGRFTLGTSDAAIAAMVMAFFPRSHHVSSDNKSYLQALRHMWVLAVEPRCLIARDVDSSEIVYLPLKITAKDGNEVGTSQLISPTLIPELDLLTSIRVDTPRYWPFYLDLVNIPRHRQSLLKSRTLYVKRRTAFLSYTEDPRGSRSLFVRSGSSAGDAAILDFPQLTNTQTHPAGDLSEFISSCSNNPIFLAFADHFSRMHRGDTNDEMLFATYCHASLLDGVLQDKPQTLQSHLTLYRYRNMSSDSRFFHLRLQDLRFAADFYSKIYDRRFSGKTENNARPPLVRESTVSAALHALDQKLDIIRASSEFRLMLSQYALGQVVTVQENALSASKKLAWFLLRDAVPVSTLLVVLKGLAEEAHRLCLAVPPPDGTTDAVSLDQGIKEVLHATGTKVTTSLGSGWSVRSLDEIIEAWKLGSATV